MLKTTLALAIAAALNLAFIATPATAANVGATATHIQAADKKAADAADDTAADEKPAKKAHKGKASHKGKAHKAKGSHKAHKKAKKAAE
jgi:hypothetical protein